MRILLLLAASALAQTAGPRGVVLVPVVNMYSAPSLDADVVSQAIYGVTVGIAEERPGWLRIRTPDDYLGWAPQTALRRLGEAEPAYAAGGRVAQVESLFAHLYRENSVTRHAPLLSVPFETALEVIAEPEADSRRWLQVRLADDRQAWVQRGDLTLEPRVRSIPELIELSRKFLGLPYTWGGTSAYGFDCSGFTQMLCRRGGVLIPRDAKPQAHWEQMAKVERSELAPGDLLYFGPNLDKINHTGFYIGNGEFIHATTNTRPVVQVSRIGDDPWPRLFVAARRWKR
jgi:cell wall-associated NlpC family hydrolase